ncbi:MAG: hypothetical protein AB1938_03000 [Myxococcota bacterium]
MKLLRLFGVLCLAGALGCPKSVPEVVEVAPPDAGVDPLLVRLDAIEAEAGEILRAQDEALWSHWTTGANLDLSRALTGHGALFAREALLDLRAARARLPAADARRAAHLEHWLMGELLARELATENDAVASLEAGLTFAVDGKDVAWRELPRLLLTEKSAVRRRALWKASLAAAERLDAALARRDARAAELALKLDSPSVLELAAETRELELDELARAAEAVLNSTEEAWRLALQRQSDADVRLPLANLTRAELPRLLRVSAAADAAFPKDQLAPRAIALLGGLGIYGRPGLTLELSERAAKHPLPLTVAPTQTDVRVSFRPVGGLRDQASLFSELGAALALREAKTGHLATERLGDPASVQALGELFSSLVASPAWLDSVGVTGEAQKAVVDAWTTHRLFVLRRAAGVVLVRLETQGLPEAEARSRYVQLMARALALPPSADDGVRWRIDTDDFLRSATTLKAAELARLAAARLSDDWFAKKESWQTISALWGRGTEAPLATRLGVASSSLAAADRTNGGLSPGPWGVPMRALSPDGGLRPGPWPSPATVALDAGPPGTTDSRRWFATTGASAGGPSPASDAGATLDGGLRPGPWPAPSVVADAGATSDGGLRPGPWPAPAVVADAGASSRDGGLRPGAWPAPAVVADAGASSRDGGLYPGAWPAPAAFRDAGVSSRDGGLHPAP